MLYDVFSTVLLRGLRVFWQTEIGHCQSTVILHTDNLLAPTVPTVQKKRDLVILDREETFFAIEKLGKNCLGETL